MWESFHDLSETSELEISSRNHHFLGDIGGMFIEEFAGIKPNPHLDDITCFEISPKFATALENASAYYETTCGQLKVNWLRKDGKVELTLNVPKGIRGKIISPKGYAFEDNSLEKQLSEGKYTFLKL